MTGEAVSGVASKYLCDRNSGCEAVSLLGSLLSMFGTMT